MSRALRFPQEVPPLRGALVDLREVTVADLPAWFARATDAESADLAGDPIPESVELGHALLQRNRERFSQQLGIRWAIVPTGSTQSVGSIGLAITSNEERTADIGFVVGRAHWGKGLCTCAAALVLDYGFGELDLSAVRAEVLQRNVASRRVLEKVGFRIEREVPGDPQSGGESEDCYIYVLRHPRAAAP
jgi:[ribosomal protein S5]-alanine N-acetyltransferase